MVQFDWDSANLLHIARHRVAQHEAEECILSEPIDLGIEHIEGEERFGHVGETQQGRILVVIATLRGESIRIVTAFDASRRWRRYYLDRRANSP